MNNLLDSFCKRFFSYKMAEADIPAKTHVSTPERLGEICNDSTYEMAWAFKVVIFLVQKVLLVCLRLIFKIDSSRTGNFWFENSGSFSFRPLNLHSIFGFWDFKLILQAAERASVHMNLLLSTNTKELKLHKKHGLLYEKFRELFPDMNVEEVHFTSFSMHS